MSDSEDGSPAGGAPYGGGVRSYIRPGGHFDDFHARGADEVDTHACVGRWLILSLVGALLVLNVVFLAVAEYEECELLFYYQMNLVRVLACCWLDVLSLSRPT